MRSCLYSSLSSVTVPASSVFKSSKAMSMVGILKAAAERALRTRL
jgi:hypothetical protein